MGLGAEIKAWLRYAFRTPDSDKAIVFYSEHASYWAYLEGLVESLERESDLSICYVTSDPDDPILTRNDPRIHAFYMKQLLPFFMFVLKCKVFVMTLTELNLLQLHRSIHPVHYVYVFHSLNSTHMAYRHRAFDHYDSILCCGPYHVAEIRRDETLRELPKKELVEGGYYRLERIYRAAQQRAEPEDGRAGKGCILVAPSWAAHNVLEEHGVALAETLLAAGYELILRPHPETIKRHPELVDAFAARFEGEPRVTVERSVASDDSLLRADVLITDWSGIAQEYAFGTERPVLYLDVPRKVHNERYPELEIEPFEASIRSRVGLVFDPADIPQIDRAIDQLMRGRAEYRERIRELREKSVYCFGRSGEVGARHILEVVNRAASSVGEAA
jgi:YidC/Oxa1 family membrane protein insertase